jgi:hypothetical protein
MTYVESAPALRSKMIMIRWYEENGKRKEYQDKENQRANQRIQ